MLLKFFPFTLLSVLFLAACSGTEPENRFFRVADGYFIPAEGWSENSPYYYIGANFWYGAILGSETAFGDRERLSAELDSLKSLGIDNLRILVGGDGPAGIPSQIEPSLQTEAGVYDESVFRGLDWLLAEMGKRRMSAVLYLNNAWEWSGGYARYLEWAGAGKAVLPSVDGWPAYMEYASRFVTDDRAKELFADHIRTVVSRTNTVTGIPYREDPAIFSWQIANEPRCFSEDDSVKTAFAEWIAESAALVKSIDPNHMVSAGSEGSWGCENDISLYEKIHSCPDIDYLTVHVWPYNWSWIGRNTVSEDLQSAIEKTDEYIDAHLAVAGRCSKPVVIEEFGYPRDGFRFEKGTPTFARDTYYSHIFRRVMDSKRECGLLAGANFWGWGGTASQSGNEYWRPGDDYCGDPAQEQQGLNSVYMADSSTVELVRKSVEELSGISGISASAVLENDWMYSSGEKSVLRVAVRTAGTSEKGLKVILLTDLGDTVSVSENPLGRGRHATDTLSFGFRLDPGFYKAIISVKDNNSVNGNTSVNDNISADGNIPSNDNIHSSDGGYRTVGTFNIGCDPEKIISPQDKPVDFDDFWAESLEELAAVRPEYRLTLIPERSNDIRRTYRVDMKSFGGEDISGIYIEPVKEGKYPVFINYMGYGAEVWYNDPSARPEAAEFTLCVRNQGLNRKPGEKDDWVIRGLADRDTYYYRGAFMDVVRAVDFAASREKADTSRIFAEGGSQGGAFTLVSASLDRRIKGIAPFVPFLSDFPDYFRIAGWPAGPVLAEAERLGLSDEELYRTLSYFDVKNFTDRIVCPVLMGFGLQDDVCPPHTNFAGYNQITSSKSYVTFPLSGHHVETEAGWWQARDAFFGKLLDRR